MDCRDATVQGYGNPVEVCFRTAEQLPFTGLDLWLLVVIGLLILLAGFWIRKSA